MIKKRNTKTKDLVRNILKRSNKALTHDDIVRIVEGQIDRVTVYRILQGFEDEGLVHKVADDSGKWHYATCNGCSDGNHSDNHIHFYCTMCKSVSCLNTPVNPPDIPSRYTICDINYLISGYCPECQSTKTNQ